MDAPESVPLELDFNLPITADLEYTTLRERANAAIRSMTLTGQGASLTPEAAAKARDMFYTDYAGQPVVVPEDPAVILQLKSLLDEYDHQVVHSAASLRNYITNRLLQESMSSTPNGKLKALELLGKISDVGLFTEKSEVTVRNMPQSEVIESLKKRIQDAITPITDVDTTSRIIPDTPPGPPDAAV